VRGDVVWIKAMLARSWTQETIATAKAKPDFLDAAVSMEREAFRVRLEQFLRVNGFEL